MTSSVFSKAKPHRQVQMVVTRFERLTRRISLSGLMSGHKASEALAEGRVKVDRVVATANFKVFSEASVSVDGFEVPPPAPAPKLWVMNKPKKVLCSNAEKEGVETLRSTMRSWDAKTVQRMGRAQAQGMEKQTLEGQNFIIVGGLPYMADGLVLLTNDGHFADSLMRPDSRILSVYDVKVSGDPPVDLLHNWRKSKGTRAGGVNFGQVFCSITSRTSAATRLRIRYVETSERPLEMLLEKAKLRVNRVRRHGFGPYLLPDIPDQGLMQVAVHKSLMSCVPKADMRQALVPTRGGILTEEGRIVTVGLQDSAVIDSTSDEETETRSEPP